MTLTYITEIKSVNDFRMHLQTNPGVFIIKFGADWCKPCKIIENDVLDYFSKMPDNVKCAIIDVDESIELYGFLKKKNGKWNSSITCILSRKSGLYSR